MEVSPSSGLSAPAAIAKLTGIAQGDGLAWLPMSFTAREFQSDSPGIPMPAPVRGGIGTVTT
jgi:hypothetical protein